MKASNPDTRSIAKEHRSDLLITTDDLFNDHKLYVKLLLYRSNKIF